MVDLLDFSDCVSLADIEIQLHEISGRRWSYQREQVTLEEDLARLVKARILEMNLTNDYLYAKYEEWQMPDDYDGCHTFEGGILAGVLCELFYERLLKIGFLKDRHFWCPCCGSREIGEEEGRSFNQWVQIVCGGCDYEWTDKIN